MTTINNNNSKDDRDVQVHNENRLLDHVAELSNIDHREDNRQNREANIQSSLALSPAVEELFKKSPFQQICEEINENMERAYQSWQEAIQIALHKLHKLKEINRVTQKEVKILTKRIKEDLTFPCLIELIKLLSSMGKEEITKEEVSELKTAYINKRSNIVLKNLASFNLKIEKERRFYVSEHDSHITILTEGINKLTDTARIYLDYTIQQAVDQGKSIATINIREMMKATGNKNESKNKFITRYMKAIGNMEGVRIQYPDPNGKDFKRLPIIDAVSTSDELSFFNISLEPNFLYLIRTIGGWQPTNPIIFSININTYRNAYYYNRAMEDNKHLNYSDSNADTVSILKLVQSSPNSPDISKKATTGKWKELLLKPFLRDMNVLIDKKILKSWEFTKGEPKNYTEFISNNIKYEFIGYPPKRKKNKKKKKIQKKGTTNTLV